jgi:polyphosphate kinase
MTRSTTTPACEAAYSALITPSSSSAFIFATIRVRSILGRFLEHHRVWYFENAGEPDVWLSSADWMGRNLFKRIEVAFPVRDPELRKRVVDEGLLLYLADNRDAWALDPDGGWKKVAPRGRARPRSAQSELLTRLREADAAD